MNCEGKEVTKSIRGRVSKTLAAELSYQDMVLIQARIGIFNFDGFGRPTMFLDDIFDVNPETLEFLKEPETSFESPMKKIRLE